MLFSTGTLIAGERYVWHVLLKPNYLRATPYGEINRPAGGNDARRVTSVR